MSYARVLGVDIETCSAADIRNGAWPYACHETTRVHCAVFALADGGRPYQTWRWVPGDAVPPLAVEHIVAGRPLVAHNAAFEISIIENILAPHHGWPLPHLDSWRDTMLLAAAANLPQALGVLAATLKGAQPKESGDLMRRLAKVRSGKHGEWVYPEPTPEELEQLLVYCEADVHAMLDCYHRLPVLPLTEAMLLAVDRRIGHRGVHLDLERASRIARLAESRKERLALKAFKLTNTELASAQSTPGVRAVLQDRGFDLPTKKKKAPDGSTVNVVTIGKQVMADMLSRDDLDPWVRALLEIRVEAGKVSSLAKLTRLPKLVGADNRLRWALRYSSAHTGRWSSSGLQVHNMPKDKLGPDRALVDRAIRDGAIEILDLVVEHPLAALSQSLRSVITAADGFELLGGDFSAIEARVLAWLAGQHDVLDTFRAGRDLYVEDAAKIGSTDRQLGKVARIALGYGMGDLKFSLTAQLFGIVLPPKEARHVRVAWREANPAIVRLWRDLEDAFRVATVEGTRTEVGRLSIGRKGDALRIRLPSGRELVYWRPHVATVTREFDVVHPDGTVETKERTVQELRYHKPTGGGMRLDSTYGGKLAENVTQAAARDLLAEAILRIDPRFPVVLHVHDSIVSEVPVGTDGDEFAELMRKMPAWASDLPMAVEVYRGRHFRG